MSSQEVYGLCLECMPAAMLSNSYAICEEICEFIGIKPQGLDIVQLASVDGSVEAIIQKLDANPDEVKKEHYRGVTTGQEALLQAIALLRVENARFLLERGFRLHDTNKPVIEWWRTRAHEKKFCEMRELLQVYKLPPLQFHP